MSTLLRRLSDAVHHLRVRITAIALLACLLLAVIGSVAFIGILHNQLEEQVATAAGQQADAVIAQIAAGTPADAAVITARADIVVQIVDTATGTVTATDHPGVADPLRLAVGWQAGVTHPGLDDTYVVAASQGSGNQLVIVGLSEEGIDASIHLAVKLCLAAVAAGCAVTSIIVWIAVGRALDPVDTMRRQAAALTAAHHDDRLQVPRGGDALTRLAVTLNDMLDRLGQLHLRQQQFVSDASHELRTPLAALRQVADVAARHPGSASVAELSADVLHQEQRMTSVVSSLLDLARLDALDELTDAIIDIDDIVFEQVAATRRRVPSLRFDVSQVSAAQVRCERSLFTSVVTNLLNNASRHANATIAVSLHERDGEAVLAVDDDGPGVPAQDRELIFERFRRRDEARSRDAGGVGLGLAIVAKVVELAGGRVQAEQSSLGGARFVVTVPLPGERA